MLKNKFKVIALLSVILISFLVPISKAENETQTINEDPEANYQNQQQNSANARNYYTRIKYYKIKYY